MWNLEVDLNEKDFIEIVLEHYSDLSGFIDKYLEERISKFTLILIPIMLLLILNYVLPFLRKI